MIRNFLYIIGLWSIIGFGCSEDKEDLTSVEDRKEQAVTALKEELLSPQNGWKLNYSPNNGSGIFYMLLKFNSDETVYIQSDLPNNNGEFFNDTLLYGIDAAMDLELIFETYGVFHYLFEQQQATSGAEFEFVYTEKDGDNLVFTSKSDPGTRTIITLIPATQADISALSEEIAQNYDLFKGQSPRLFGGVPPSQQLYFPGSNLSIFWEADLLSRTIYVNQAGLGSTFNEINTNGSLTVFDHFTGFIFQNDQLQLLSPFQANISGISVNISSINLTDFSMTGVSLCDTSSENTPVYQGTVENMGDVTVTKSLFSYSGNDFLTDNQQYSVNILYVLDDELSSLSVDGSIAEKFPDAVAFIMTYNFTSDSIPAYSVGLLVEDEQENRHYYLRSFDPTGSIGNSVSVSLLNDFYYSGTPQAGEEQSLIEITDEIFAGGKVYAYYLDIGNEDITVFQLYNPCNSYELVLVR